MSSSFCVIILGGTGQVGSAVVKALLSTPACTEVIMVVRRPLKELASRCSSYVCDTSSADFSKQMQQLASDLKAKGERVVGVSCAGVGQGSAKWTEAELLALEVGVVGQFAAGLKAAQVSQFCLLSAYGANAKSRIKYARVMGRKEETVAAVGFAQLTIFQPGIIVGNSHTPKWLSTLSRMLIGPLADMGNIEQQHLAKAFAVELEQEKHSPNLVRLNNTKIRALLV